MHLPEKALVIALDHAQTLGVVEGLENPGQVLDEVIAAGPDGRAGPGHSLAERGRILPRRGEAAGQTIVNCWALSRRNKPRITRAE